MGVLTVGFTRPTGTNAPKVRKMYVADVSDITSIPAAVAGVVSTDIVMAGGATFIELEIIESTGKKLFKRSGFENDSANYAHLAEAFVTGSPANIAALATMDNKRLLVVTEGNNGPSDMWILGEVSKGLIVKTAESVDEEDQNGFVFIASNDNYSHAPYAYSGVIALPA